MMIKKNAKITSAIVALILMITLTLSAFAVSYSVSWSFNTGSGNAYVDGSANGKFYSLNKGASSLRLEDGSNCAKGTYYVNLMVKDGPFGLWSSTVESHEFPAAPGNTHAYTYTIPKNHDKYYLVVTGEGAYTYYEASGSFVQ